MLNMTDLLDSQWAPSSESSWTTIFALFALYLSNHAELRTSLTIWNSAEDGNGKWYAPRRMNSRLELDGLTFDRVAIEPRSMKVAWPGISAVPSSAVAGFSSDIVLLCKKNDGRDHFIIIENKIRGILQESQLENYPRLASWLLSKNASFEILILKSVGLEYNLFEQIKLLQEEIPETCFGILLWEEVIRKMEQTKFDSYNIPVKDWGIYTEVLDSVCAY